MSMGKAYPNTGVGSILNGRQKRVIYRIKGHGEGTVNNTTVELSTEIDLHHVTLVQNHLVTGVGSIMSRAVVDTKATGETHATLEVVALFQTLVTRQSTDGVLNAFRDLGQSLARSDVLLCILTDLTVNLSTLAVLCQEIIVQAVEMTLLLVGSTVGILVQILADLAFGV